MAISTLRESGFDVALGIVGRRKWIGLSAFAAAVSLSVPLAFFLPDVYRGMATIAVDSQESSANFVRAPLPELETTLVTIQQELLSRARLTELIARLNLYPTWQGPGSPEAKIQRLREDLRVEPSGSHRGRPTTIGLRIAYIGLDPRSAAAVPNALANLYIEENTKLRERQTGQMAGFLKTQLDNARLALETQQARINAFKEQRAGRLPEQISVNMVTMERLNMRPQLNNNDQMRTRERLDRLIAFGETDGDAAPDAMQILKQRLADLQVWFTEEHPDVLRTQAQIAQLEQERAGRASASPALPRRDTAIISSTRAELESLQRQEQLLRSEIAVYEHRIQSAPRVEQELETLRREYQTARDSYDSLLKRFEEAQLASRLEQAKHSASFRILDAAIVPAGPAAPNRMRLLLMFCFFAVAAGIGAMLLADHLDTSFHTVGQVRMFTTIPVLASIPYVRARRTLRDVLRTAAAAVAVISVCVVLAGFSYWIARENTQLVWTLSAPQI